ncbi:hypothetical protein SAMN02983003_0117 [Devosia enhydra]|uniref:Uncharacterized protein n=1 Tax=Devosia enhydra TaxID=665118 RepID=A0A1K2HSB5_9HYPH|nr:hypothetical protein [Devosia enhydra]SFZ80769.1 hypothetical protein SAMN02983003_0117 [Devosia enhydra]
MTELTEEEAEALARFDAPAKPVEVDPMVYAKLLSMGLVEQHEGGPFITATGVEILNRKALDDELDAELEQTFPASDPPNLTRPD